MHKLLVLVGGMLLIPAVYFGVLSMYRENFKQEKNQKRYFLRSIPEFLVMISAEAAFIGIWRETFLLRQISEVQWILLAIGLSGMTILCITDLWEKVVPNRILLGMLLLWFVIVGLCGIQSLEKIWNVLFAAVLGVIFCSISFGFCFLLSRGSMGAGDVKLSIILGLYLGGEYVVGAVLYGCILCTLYSIIMLWRKKLSRKDSIPFVPFLYAGMILRYLAR